MTAEASVRDCVLCRREAGHDEPPGGWVYRDRWWSLGVLPAAAVPGWLVLQPRKHVEGLWDLEPQASGSLGHLLQRTSAALVEELHAERVYFGAFGERIAHWHLLIAARPDGLAESRRGPALLLDPSDLVDQANAVRVARAVAPRIANRRTRTLNRHPAA